MSQTYSINTPVTIVNAGTTEAIAQHEGTYDHANIPSDAIAAALANTVGTPSAENPVVLADNVPGSGEGLDPSFGAIFYSDLNITPSNGVTVPNLGVCGSLLDFSVVGAAWTKTDVPVVGSTGGGHYLTKGDTNVAGFRQKAIVDMNTATAAYVSHSSTQIVIDDTANNLQTLFQQNGLAVAKRKFKVVLRQAGAPNKCASAYIGTISKSTNRYTINVYTTDDGSSNAWNGDSITGALTYWGIYSAQCDFAQGLVTGAPEGITVGFFYYAADPTVDYVHLFSNWDGYVDAARSCQCLVQQTTTNSTIIVAQRNAANSQADLTATCLTQNRFHGVVCRFLNGVASRLSLNGEVIAIDNASVAGGLVSVHGVSFCCPPVQDGTALPNGSAWAYPTIWRGNLPVSVETAWYHYHKNKLGLQDNH